MGSKMDLPIQFNNQLFFRAAKIHDKPVDRMLALEF